MNQLKLYREALIGKTICGLGRDRVILDTGEWWKLSVEFEGDRLDYVGNTIESAHIVDGKLELILSNNNRLRLHWRNELGIITGPLFPEDGKMRAWRPDEDDPDLARLDRIITVLEKFYERTSNGNR